MDKPLAEFSVSFVSSPVVRPSPTSTVNSGYSFRSPDRGVGDHATPNLVIYIVPALFGVGLLTVLSWWLYLRRGRRARAKAFRESLEVEARLSSGPQAITFLRPVSSSCSLSTVFEKSLGTTPVFPPSRVCDELSVPPPLYSPGWSKVAPADLQGGV